MNPAISPAQPSTSTAGWTWRSALRVTLIIALTLAGAAEFAGDFALPWHPYGTFGFTAGIGGRIDVVQPDSPAARAGLRAGDRVDVEAIGLHERRRLIYLSVAPPGAQITLPVIEGTRRRTVTLVATPYPRTAAANITNTIETLERLAFLAIAMALVLLRPSLLTWSFFAIAMANQPGFAPYAFFSDAWILPNVFFVNASIIVGAVAGVVFAMLFPRERPSRAVRNTAIALTFAGAGLLVFDAINQYSITFAWGARGSASWVGRLAQLNDAFLYALSVAAVAMFAVNYLRAPSNERLRMQWVALGFVIGDASFVVPAFLSDYLDIHLSLTAVNVLLCLTIFIPLSVAYAILRYRVIDVRFFISRALVYGTLTTIAVAVLALLEAIAKSRLELTRFGVAIELASAVLIGIGMSKVHVWINAAFERNLFRMLHDAEKRLRTVGKAMMFAQNEGAIDVMLAGEAAAALKLAYVRVDRELDPDAPMVMELHAERSAMVRGDDLVVPLLGRNRLLGCAFFGPHSSGAAIDPNEREVLESFASDAAVAYDHVAVERSAAENAALQAKLAIEEAKNRQLAALLERGGKPAT
ncbi:MAG: hypothetical protein WBD74_13815 [Candidatus Aquilonibacter sp.]